MTSPHIKIIPFSPSISNFQKCILGSSELVSELEEIHGKFFENFLSIHFPSRGSRVLVRACKSSVGDVAGVIQGDLRVEELLFPTFPQGESQAIPTTTTTTTAFLDSSSSTAEEGKKNKSVWENERREMDLCRHLVGKMRKMNVEELNSCRDVDEEAGDLPSMRFNDALCCTSKDIQMLKSGTINMMRLTVISDSPLSDFPYQRNQLMRRDGESSLSKNSRVQQTSRSPKTVNNKAGGSEVSDEGDITMRPVAPSWKLLREKIRQAFQAYDIHVKGNTLVDLRDCPLSSSRKMACPSVAFVFVEECWMRNSESDIGRVASKTEVLITHVHHISYYKRQLSALISKRSRSSGDNKDGKVYGLENATRILNSIIEMQERVIRGGETGLQKYFGGVDKLYSHGLLIAGPSGCGKSLAVRDTVKKLRANLLVFNSLVPAGHEFSSFCETWTEIFMKSVESAGIYPTVLLIPKIDECLLIKQNKSKSFVEKLLNHVCNLLDSVPKNSMLTVVATTDKPYLIPAKLRRAGRLEREVYIGAPTEEERLNILKSLCTKVPQLSKLDLDSVAKRTPGYVGQDLIRVAHLAILKSYEENCSEVFDAHIKYALSRILPTVLQGSLGVVGIQRATSLDHIAGLHSVKLNLIKAIVWPLKYPHAFRTMGITPPKGILLYSPPGYAKTTLVRAIAASHQTNFLSVSAAELFSSGVGDSEKIVADLFHRARMASPCILFIDELEAIVGSRQMSQKREKTSNESILSMLLTEMDGVGTQAQCVSDRSSQATAKDLGPSVLVVAATNRIDLIDSALIRPGRFDKLIHVPPLDESGRLELLNICSKTIPFAEDMDLQKIAAETENYTGADLVNLCREAALFSLTEDMKCNTVSSANFTKAKDLLGPSLATR